VNRRRTSLLDQRRRDYVGPDGLWRPARPEGLARVLAKAGYGARARAEDIVRQGRVAIDGETVADPSVAVDTGCTISLDGRPLREAPRRYYALHKPLSLDCRGGGRADPVRDHLPQDVPGLEPAGRLDGRSAGLLLVSNDNWWNACVATQRRLEKEFQVQIRGEMSDMELGILQGGMHLQSLGFVKPVRVRVVERTAAESVVALTVRGGKIRQVRRVFQSMRHDVITLTLVRIGTIRLGGLPPGQLRSLTRAEVRTVELTRGGMS